MELKLINNKAQVAMIDLVIAFVIAFGLVAVLLSYIDLPTEVINDRIQTEDKLLKAVESTNILLNSHGFPTNWDQDNVEISSIVKSPNVIDFKKLNQFRNLSYEKKKELLNINDFNYTLIIKVDNSTIKDGITNLNLETVAVNRIALLGGEYAQIQFKVW